VYLLDTNILSELLRPRPDVALVRRIFSTSPAALFASEMTRYELRYGAALHPNGDRLWATIERDLLPLATWLPVDEPVALEAAILRARLRRDGRPIDVPDALLAATARTRDLVLVTRNLRHFAPVPRLIVESW
jgi:predicted nucleic acid-binding protein